MEKENHFGSMEVVASLGVFTNLRSLWFFLGTSLPYSRMSGILTKYDCFCFKTSIIIIIIIMRTNSNIRLKFRCLRFFYYWVSFPTYILRPCVHKVLNVHITMCIIMHLLHFYTLCAYIVSFMQCALTQYTQHNNNNNNNNNMHQYVSLYLDSCSQQAEVGY
jgi:hypothetical protein